MVTIRCKHEYINNAQSCLAGGIIWKHWGPSPQPSSTHPEPDANWSRGQCYTHGTRVQESG